MLLRAVVWRHAWSSRTEYVTSGCGGGSGGGVNVCLVVGRGGEGEYGVGGSGHGDYSHTMPIAKLYLIVRYNTLFYTIS